MICYECEKEAAELSTRSRCILCENRRAVFHERENGDLRTELLRLGDVTSYWRLAACNWELRRISSTTVSATMPQSDNVDMTWVGDSWRDVEKLIVKHAKSQHEKDPDRYQECVDNGYYLFIHSLPQL